MPMAASSSASPANAERSWASSLGRSIDRATTASISRSRATGTVGSMSRTTARTVGAAGDSGRVVLTTIFIVAGENPTQVAGLSVTN